MNDEKYQALAPSLEDYNLTEDIYERGHKLKTGIFWKNFFSAFFSLIGGVWFANIFQDQFWVIGGMVTCGILLFFLRKSRDYKEFNNIKEKVSSFEKAFEEYYLQHINDLYDNHLYRKRSTSPEFKDSFEKFGSLIELLSWANRRFFTVHFYLDKYRSYYIRRERGSTGSGGNPPSSESIKENTFLSSGNRAVQTSGQIKLNIVSPEIHFQVPRKVDWLLVNATKKLVGDKGEVLVLHLQKEHLKLIGRSDLADRVVHSSTVEDGLGYDILSFFDDGKEKYIEVKSTTNSLETPFFMSANEQVFLAQHPKDYFLYRVALNSGIDERPIVHGIPAGELVSKGRFEINQYKVTIDNFQTSTPQDSP